MKLITNKSRNLLYRIQPFVNCTIDFQTSYAVLKQTTADTYNLSFKGQLFKGVNYAGVALFSGEPISSVGKFTKTFTTPSTLPDHNTVIFGLNGATNDTTFKCVIQLKPSTTYTFTCNFTNITQGSISWKDMMLVEGSTVGEYEPYSYNLLDKWKYPATTTTNGVTFTNNENGSITVDGTAIATSGYILFNYQRTLIVGHRYLLSGAPSNASSDAYIQCYDDTNYEWLTDKGNGGIATFPKEIVSLSGSNMIRIRIGSGYNVNGLLFEPALYDLTLMYGAGNEPTTVNQFYTDHPELKVSPLGFIGLKNLEISNKNIKRLKYATMTRNLFDLNKFGTYTSSLISIDGNTLLNIIPSGDKADTFAFTCSVSVKKNTNYIISMQDHSYDIFSCYVYTDEIFGNRLTYGEFPLKFNSGDNESLAVGFYSIYSRRQPNVASWVQGPQIEEGSTATPYVPYGYLDLGIIPSNSGYILDKYNNLSEELLEENIEIDNVTYHIPDKTNILLNKIEGKTNKIVQLLDESTVNCNNVNDWVGGTGSDTNLRVANGVVSIDGTLGSYSGVRTQDNKPIIKGRKYYISTWAMCSKNASNVLLPYTYGFSNSTSTLTANEWKNAEKIDTANVSDTTSIGVRYGRGESSEETVVWSAKKPQFFDLTAMYGFGKEPTTVEQFKKDYPQFFDEKLDGIWNVRTSGISSTGKNLFIYDTIAKYDYNKDYKKYNANNVIFFKAGTYSITTTNADSAVYVQAFSEPNIAIINILDVISFDTSSPYMYTAWNGYALSISFKYSNVLQFTLSKDCYLTFCADPNVVTNPMIELGTVGTTYEPYTENKIDLLSTQTLNGINGVNDYIEVIDKGNGLYDLKKTQNIASVDMGSLGFDVDGNNFVTGAISSDIKTPVNNNTVGNYICQKYVNCALNKSLVNGDFGVNSSGYLYFRDSAYTTVSDFQTAVTGTMFYYQLKTPVVTTIATNLTYNQVSAIRTNGGLLLVNDNNNQKYVQPDVTLKENYQYKN